MHWLCGGCAGMQGLMTGAPNLCGRRQQLWFHDYLRGQSAGAGEGIP